MMLRRHVGLLALSMSPVLTQRVAAQDNRIDVVTPMAPELAAFGVHAVGVRTITVTDATRPDILRTKPGGPTMRYDRSLALEVWYPSALLAPASALLARCGCRPHLQWRT